MEIIKIVTGVVSTNCYILYDEQNNAAIVDPADGTDRILKILADEGLNLKALLITHGHFDHIGAVAQLHEKTGAKVYMHEKDAIMLTNPDSDEAGMRFGTIPCEVDVLLKGGEQFQVGDMTFDVMHTPGHTLGGVCYITCDCIFSGDTLFNLTIGRTDLPGGDYNTLIDSVKRISNAYPNDMRVFPGHECSTSLDFERDNNPYMR